MSETAHEPTMEEILASIRRIISEDDAPEEKAKPAPEPEVVAAEPEPEVAFDEPEDEPEVEEEDVLELTTPVATPKPAVSIGDIDAFDPEPVAVAPKPAPKPAPRVDYDATSHLVSERTVQSAVSAFGQLTSASLLPREGRTIEDLLSEILRPMLQDWLDGNLSAIVETAVREEVERLARQARR
ncbi:DUF2497 domain-containing protein [Asticcacaulis excentricus]|uniref:DUF2497 domain-containing protein n=1 Tax=Asticcacaulis excentricus (strain ATCC 15261 / DSM 4724 / KCTC 12464 / NCIMB 9791 / VKM B-1370 / CB 48) TaxID=573065 RepID=E8RTF1_ASTEC|nr:DUF2497 domain-containing protein [Asticcacaulis excentricus]ADU14772.1 Protein of unknown function DUF2497 [Asticcacaulis excentricus CB 48]